MTAAPTVSTPTLRAATFADHDQVHRLESTYFDDSLVPEDRRRLFEDNPLWPKLRDSWPVGWVLEADDGRIVGSVTNIPSAYVFDGEQLLCANGHCWAVLEEYRGYASVLMDEYFTQPGPDLVISAKVGADAAALWELYAQRVPVGDWSTAAYVITDHRAVARAGLERKGVPLARALALPVAAALRIKDALTPRRRPAAPPAYVFRTLDGFDDRFDLFWSELVARNPRRLLAVRDGATLTWHYGVPSRLGRVWVLGAFRDGALRAYCVLKRHRRPPGVDSIKIVDFQKLDPEAELLPGFVALALQRASAEGCAFLEHHGVGLPAMRWFDHLAPYRAAKPAWSFYYAADDPTLAARLADPAVWDPSEYDGDSSLK